MFKTTERAEVKTIDSIGVAYGILYQMKFTAFPNPLPIKKRINDELCDLIQYSNVLIETFVINSRALAGKTAKLLESIDLSVISKIEFSPTISNNFMELFDKAGLKVGQSFYLTKEKTDNEYKPKLIVEKLVSKVK